MRTLVLGGIRSGKSRWAESAIVEHVGPQEPVRYLATALDLGDDPSWSERMAAHCGRRPAHWSTVETADVAAQLREFTGSPTLVDDVGGWLTATLDRRGAWDSGGSVGSDIDELLAAVRGFGSPLVIVSPEVGLTVVPATEAGRRFADELGMLNQELAELCDRVVLLIAGLPVEIKRDDR